MNIKYGRALKIFALTSLCASLLTACNNQSLFEKRNPASDAARVEATASTTVKSTSKVIDFKIVANQTMSHRGPLSLNDVAKDFPQLNERAQMLASVDQIIQTESGHWQFYANYKLLFTLVSLDGTAMQAINTQDPMFNTITLSVNDQTKLADAIRFNLSDCQYASTEACDAVDAIIYVQTVNGTPRLDQDQDQDKDQDKDQDQSQDKDQDKDQDTDQDQDQNGSDQTPPVTSGTTTISR